MATLVLKLANVLSECENRLLISFHLSERLSDSAALSGRKDIGHTAGIECV